MDPISQGTVTLCVKEDKFNWLAPDADVVIKSSTEFYGAAI